MKPVVLVCLDGCSWNYFEASKMPNVDETIRIYSSVTCNAVVPTVTNVNNASILTGEFPSRHGITGNYYLDRDSGLETYMDSPRFLRCDTHLARISKTGFKTLLLTVKDKLRRLLAEGVTCSFSLEKPLDWAIREVGSPPDVYSAEASIWLLNVALEAHKKKFDVIYVSTTDYVAHMYEPKSSEAKEYMREVDERIGLFLEQDVTLGIVADHGMNTKHVKIDLEKILSEKGIRAKVLPIIKDEYLKHHQNLGGAVYIFLENKRESIKACDVLLGLDGVEYALTSEDASQRFNLPIDRIGDILVLGSKNSVFGPVREGEIESVALRSHGSLHEGLVPFILNRKVEVKGNIFNRDVFQILFGQHPV